MFLNKPLISLNQLSRNSYKLNGITLRSPIRNFTPIADLHEIHVCSTSFLQGTPTPIFLKIQQTVSSLIQDPRRTGGRSLPVTNTANTISVVITRPYCYYFQNDQQSWDFKTKQTIL